MMSKQRHWNKKKKQKNKPPPPVSTEITVGSEMEKTVQLARPPSIMHHREQSGLWLHAQNMPNGTHLYTLACSLSCYWMTHT